jgi:diaminopimelate epimerase
VATHLRGACGREASLELPGGPLQIRWDDNDHLQMAGPAVHVFSGVLADNSEASAGASDAGYQQALALLDNLSLDQMVNLANNSLEERNRRRISGR